MYSNHQLFLDVVSLEQPLAAACFILCRPHFISNESELTGSGVHVRGESQWCQLIDAEENKHLCFFSSALVLGFIPVLVLGLEHCEMSFC